MVSQLSFDISAACVERNVPTHHPPNSDGRPSGLLACVIITSSSLKVNVKRDEREGGRERTQPASRLLQCIVLLLYVHRCSSSSNGAGRPAGETYYSYARTRSFNGGPRAPLSLLPVATCIARIEEEGRKEGRKQPLRTYVRGRPAAADWTLCRSSGVWKRRGRSNRRTDRPSERTPPATDGAAAR